MFLRENVEVAEEVEAWRLFGTERELGIGFGLLLLSMSCEKLRRVGEVVCSPEWRAAPLGM